MMRGGLTWTRNLSVLGYKTFVGGVLFSYLGTVIAIVTDFFVIFRISEKKTPEYYLH